MLLKFSSYIYKSISKQVKFIQCVYHKQWLRKVPFSKHVYFVQICPVFAGPVTYYYALIATFCHYYNKYTTILVVYNIVRLCYVTPVSLLTKSSNIIVFCYYYVVGFLRYLNSMNGWFSVFSQMGLLKAQFCNWATV